MITACLVLCLLSFAFSACRQTRPEHISISERIEALFMSCWISVAILKLNYLP